MQLKTIKDLTNIAGKYILLRDDFNVQIVDGIITDAFRIEQSLPTIHTLKNAGARIAIISHLGRPAGIKNPEFTLAPIAEKLSELLGQNVPLISDCIGAPVATARAEMNDGDVVLLENVRFYAAEEKNDSEFAKQLAHGFDFYVNDAFAVSHRAHASTVGITAFLPSYAGELLGWEIEQLSKLLENPARPLLGIVAGAKISSKLGVIKTLVKFCDKMIMGGGIGNTFQFALGKQIGNSLHEPTMKDTVLEILQIAKESGCEIYLPIDKGVGKEFDPNTPRTNKTFDEILPTDVIMDAGPKSLEQYEQIVDSVKTVIWNGSIGMAEWPNWNFGTFGLARHIAKRTREGKLESIVGGGDTVAALDATGTADDMTYVSTGGGAFLEFIEGIPLPGIKALEV